MLRRRSLSLCAAVFILGLCPLMAASITYTISGTLGPILAGSDPLGANGESGVLTIVTGAGLTPTSTTSTSATYTLPKNAITVNIGGTIYGTIGTSTLVYNFPASARDTIVVTTNVSVSGINGKVVGTASLAHGSFNAKVKNHPQKFTPTPQTLTAAKKAGGAGSQIKYTVPFLGSTVVGLNGTASN